MFRIKNAFLALRIRWVISILLLIQFTYGLSTITGTSNIFYNLHYMNSQSLLDLDSTYLVVPDKITDELQKQYTKNDVEEIYDNLKRHPDVVAYGTYYEDNVILDTKAHPLDPQLIADLTNHFLGLDEPIIRTIVIDEPYNQILNLKFTDQDFRKNSNDETNVLVGSYFKRYYKIGDIINAQYKIIGFLPDKYIVNNNTSNVYLKLDKAMLIPMPEDIYTLYDSMISRLQFNTVLKLRPGADLDQLTQMIQLKGDSVPLGIHNLGENIRQDIKVNAYLEIPQMVLGLSFILFSVIGMVVTTIVSIMIRKREFGIKLALGESEHGILYQIIIENLIIAVAGLGLSLLHFMWKYKGLLQFSSDMNLASPLDYKANGSVIGIVFIILLAVILISNFFIYLFIRKQELKTLIGGME